MINIHYEYQCSGRKKLYVLSHVIYGERMTVRAKRCEPVKQIRHQAYENAACRTHDHSYFHIQGNRLHLNGGTAFDAAGTSACTFTMIYTS